MNLMNMTLLLSRHTANSLQSLLDLPFHYVIGMFNALQKQQKEEAEQNDGAGNPSMPSGISGRSSAGNFDFNFR